MQDTDSDDIGNKEQRNTSENIAQSNIPPDAVDDEAIEANWWCDEANFCHFHDNDAKPDGIEAERNDRRMNHRQGEQQHANSIHKHAQDGIGDQDADLSNVSAYGTD